MKRVTVALLMALVAAFGVSAASADTDSGNGIEGVQAP